MTPYGKLFEAFFSKMPEDIESEWDGWTEEEVIRDVVPFLHAAVARFKFPKHSLEYDDSIQAFKEDLSNREIQILATFMRVEWLNRVILDGENVRPQYTERDFSQANLIDKFRNMLSIERTEAKRLESIYYRLSDGEHAPFDYSKFAGSNE